jgi:solute:Na+ symporter, SSS family
MLNGIIVGFYVILVLVVGVYYSRKMKSMREFSLSNQRFPGPVVLATISATFIGAEFVFGFAQQAYSVGIAFIFPLLGWCLCKLIIAHYIVPRVAVFHDAISVGDIMAKDYGLTGRVITGVCSAILCLGFVGAQISACGLLFHYFFDFSYVAGILLGCAIVVFYSALGGFRAVAFTDVVQFAVLIIAVPMVCNVELIKIGGLAELLESLPQSHIMPTPTVVLEQLAWLFIFLIPLLDPAIMQRIMMDKDHKKVSRAFQLSALADIPIYLVVCLIGLIALIKNPTLDANLAFAYVMSELPEGIKGLAIAGILAVIMSTADSFLNAASVSLVHDVIKPCFKSISEKSEMRLAQAFTVLLGIAAIIGALRFKRILDLIIYFQNISWVPLIMVPLYASIFGLGANTRAFILSGLFGVSIQFIWPTLFGTTPEIFLALLSLIASTLGLLISHAISRGWLRVRPVKA